MNSFDEMLNELKKATNTTKNKELADVLGIARTQYKVGEVEEKSLITYTKN